MVENVHGHYHYYADIYKIEINQSVLGVDIFVNIWSGSGASYAGISNI